jgi:hypothetical protein
VVIFPWISGVDVTVKLSLQVTLYMGFFLCGRYGVGFDVLIIAQYGIRYNTNPRFAENPFCGDCGYFVLLSANAYEMHQEPVVIVQS